MIRQQGFIDGRIFTAMMWFFLIVGLGIGAILFVFIPWLWRLLKPWIHSITG
jgi:hypothetical protein